MSQSNRYHGYSRENGKAILGAFFLVKKGCGSRAAPSSLTAVSEISFTACAPQGVNSKIVLWTVFEEGTPCKRGRPLDRAFYRLPSIRLRKGGLTHELG